MSIDLFDIRSLLSEEEQMVSDNVSRFVDDNVKPVIQECFEKHKFPHELIQPIAELGLLGSSIEGYECDGNKTSYSTVAFLKFFADHAITNGIHSSTFITFN